MEWFFKTSKVLVFFALIFTFKNTALAANPENVYVQSIKAQIKSEKKTSSPNIATAKRGESLVVLGMEDNWYKVKLRNKEGWVSKLFVSPKKPVGVADVSENAKISPEKLSRKRAHNYSTSATTRGLSAGDRGRGNVEKYRANVEAVEKIEKEKIEPKELENFENDGELNED